MVISQGPRCKSCKGIVALFISMPHRNNSSDLSTKDRLEIESFRWPYTFLKSPEVKKNQKLNKNILEAATFFSSKIVTKQMGFIVRYFLIGARQHLNSN